MRRALAIPLAVVALPFVLLWLLWVAFTFTLHALTQD